MHGSLPPALEAVGFERVTVEAGTLFALLLDAKEPTGRATSRLDSDTHSQTKDCSCETITVLTFPRDQLDENTI